MTIRFLTLFSEFISSFSFHSQVHPDKNPDDRERAQAAFDALRKANSLLEDDKTRRKCYEIVEEARGRTGMNMEEKRKKKRKEAIAKGIPPTGNNIKVCSIYVKFVIF